MTPEHFDAILKNALAKSDGEKNGFSTLPEGTTLSLYVSHDGASLVVPKVEAVRGEGELVYAKTQKKETFTVVRSDVFAISMEGGGGTPARRAGFG